MNKHSKAPPGRPEDRAPLESIGHLTDKVCATWGTAELDAYLSRLLMDARDGARRGLPVEVAGDLLFLYQANKMRRALDVARVQHFSVEEAFRRVDEADQSRKRIDPFDDPTVSRDTVITRSHRGEYAPEREIIRHGTGSQAQGLGELLLMLVRSKWVMGALILVICTQVFWPYFKPFF